MGMKVMKSFGIMIMMIIMAILSEANENANFADEIKWKCGGLCLVKCLPKIANKIMYPICLAGCYAGCHNLSLDIAYNCINDCDSVNSIHINSGNHQSVANAMNSCMQGCKRKNNNL
ncbi:hypothetical protein V8G54_017066 [Vigna mungo]|uniref:Thionin-like protein n=1 Tax=Vigna mungo TaxID=3915 RepID=A0AAQ3NHF6_VIGMU